MAIISEKSNPCIFGGTEETPLGPTFRGPYPITKKMGTSCLEVQLGVYVDGTPRTSVVHWNLCQPAVLKLGTEIATRPKLGRKAKERPATEWRHGFQSEENEELKSWGPFSNDHNPT